MVPCSSPSRPTDRHHLKQGNQAHPLYSPFFSPKVPDQKLKITANVVADTATSHDLLQTTHRQIREHKEAPRCSLIIIIETKSKTSRNNQVHPLEKQKSQNLPVLACTSFSPFQSQPDYAALPCCVSHLAAVPRENTPNMWTQPYPEYAYKPALALKLEPLTLQKLTSWSSNIQLSSCI